MIQKVQVFTFFQLFDCFYLKVSDLWLFDQQNNIVFLAFSEFGEFISQKEVGRRDRFVFIVSSETPFCDDTLRESYKHAELVIFLTQNSINQSLKLCLPFGIFPSELYNPILKELLSDI